MPLMRNAIGVPAGRRPGRTSVAFHARSAKPAVPFGGIYRIIDVTLSNCLNSDLRRIFVLTQYKALSLNRHVRRGWSSLMGHGEYIEVLTPQMRVSQHWYQGTADAVYQNIYSIGSEQSNYTFILSGDHIYKMNYQKMLQQHVESGADVTVATFEVDSQQAAGASASSKPTRTGASSASRKTRRTQALRAYDPQKVNASMGSTSSIPSCSCPSSSPTPKIPIPSTISQATSSRASSKSYRVFAYNSRDENKKEESLLARRRHRRGLPRSQHGPGFRLAGLQPLRQELALHTWQQQYPPAKFVFADPDRMGVALDSIVGAGSIVSGGRVTNPFSASTCA